MSNANNKETLSAANSGEISDKALEAVSGGSDEVEVSPETLRLIEKANEILDKDTLMRANQGAQILLDLEKNSAANNSQGQKQELTNLARILKSR